MKDGRSKQHEDVNDWYFRKGHRQVKSREEERAGSWSRMWPRAEGVRKGEERNE